MFIRKKHLIFALSTLVIALVAGGKKGQDTLELPRPSLSDDYLLGMLPNEVFRIDASRLTFAESEGVSLISEVQRSQNQELWSDNSLSAHFILDAYRGAPALFLEKDLSLELPEESLSLVLVSRDHEESDFRIHVLGYDHNGRSWSLGISHSYPELKAAEVPLRIIQLKSKSYLQVPQGQMLAELVILNQPLSEMQAINITDSLIRKWIDQKSL